MLPLLAVGFPPLTDALGHLGRYAIQTGAASSPALQEGFTYRWQLIGNLGVDLLVEVLQPLIGLEPAVRLVVIATQLFAAGGIILTNRALHGRITPFAVLALPLIYGFPFQYGFLNFSLSMALALVVFPAWLAIRKRRSGLVAGVSLAIAGLLLWLCHTFGWAFLGLLCGSFSLHARWAEGKRGPSLVAAVLADCGALLLPLVPMLMWRTSSGDATTGGWSALLKIVWLFSIFRSGWGMADWISAGLVVGTICALLVLRPVRMNPAIAIAVLFCLAAFVALPSRVFGSYYADMRLLPYTLIIALLGFRSFEGPPRIRAGLMVSAMAFLLFRIGLNTADFIEKDRRIVANLAALDAIAPNSRVVNFAVEACDTSWRVNPLKHIGGFAIARRSAFTNEQWDVAGANGLSVHYPAGRQFVADPSQSVTLRDCPATGLPALTEVLPLLPVSAFDYLWVHGVDPQAVELPFTAREVWRGESGIVYALGDTPASR